MQQTFNSHDQSAVSISKEARVSMVEKVLKTSLHPSVVDSSSSSRITCSRQTTGFVTVLQFLRPSTHLQLSILPTPDGTVLIVASLVCSKPVDRNLPNFQKFASNSVEGWMESLLLDVSESKQTQQFNNHLLKRSATYFFRSCIHDIRCRHFLYNTNEKKTNNPVECCPFMVTGANASRHLWRW